MKGLVASLLPASKPLAEAGTEESNSTEIARHVNVMLTNHCDMHTEYGSKG
jgi:hypothetical protein